MEINDITGQIVRAAVAKLLPLHQAQLLAYLKLSQRPVGLLINFNVPHLRQGIKRMVN
ncbi:MAG TPA: GxxExxY protein [Gemmatimonadaceae bacterium]|jgi:GxxExxY protein|nr:GxxExxY protein [Gemmatimonadaceae bacterium]